MVTERQIKVNQIGYPIETKKTAVFTKSTNDFEVIDQKTNEVVYRGQLSDPIKDEASGETVYLGDFTELTKTGRYQIKSDKDQSASFIISENPYDDARQGVLKAFYYYRCGMELTEEFAGDWAHAACHTEKGILYDNQNKKLDGTGGWHDSSEERRVGKEDGGE